MPTTSGPKEATWERPSNDSKQGKAFRRANSVHTTTYEDGQGTDSYVVDEDNYVKGPKGSLTFVGVGKGGAGAGRGFVKPKSSFSGGGKVRGAGCAAKGHGKGTMR